MREAVHIHLPVERAIALYPALGDRLPAINQALRHINYGQMDYLPYDEAVPAYHLYMRAELTAEGPGRPPRVGHWALEITRDDRDYILVLQGKQRAQAEWADLIFPCGPTAESRALTEEADT
jgi:hypothetical protein